MASFEANAYYKWYVRDFRSSRKVQRMGYVARGLYRELLDEQFLEASLPNDITALADICGCPVKIFEKAWPEIRPCLEDDGSGRLINAKMEHLRTAKDKERANRAKAGRLGGLAKHLQASARQVPESAEHVGVNPKQMTYSRAEQSTAAPANGMEEKRGRKAIPISSIRGMSK